MIGTVKDNKEDSNLRIVAFISLSGSDSYFWRGQV